ncbi:MAG: amidase [Hyphomonas sp.]|nr:amidase [Hyphomonas sp.]
MGTTLDLAAAGALETAGAIRSGEISALEACDAAIARIEKLDGQINAVVVRDFDRAREAAKAVDASRKPDDARALLGVPMTVKESNDVAGLPSTWGFEMFKDLKAPRDAAVVERLKGAGAVILGKTNVPVALADWQSENPVYGRTLNPFDKTRSPGGSSGGAAAALATGMVPLEIGSDIGGSIRAPSHMCGVFGHKPSYGIVPLRGHGFPGTDGVDVPLAVVGPMARNTADLAATLDIIAGPESAGLKLDLPPAGVSSLNGLRVRIIDRMPGVPSDGDTREALATLSEALDREGAAVSMSTDDFPALEPMMDSYIKMLNTVILRGTPDAKPIDAHTWMDLVDGQMQVTRAWAQVFRDTDVLISPIFSTPAFPYQSEPDWAKRMLLIDNEPYPYGGQLAWAAIATYAGLPATAVPVGKSRNGLPIGVQIIAGPYGDRRSLAVASLLEEAGLTL